MGAEQALYWRVVCTNLHAQAQVLRILFFYFLLFSCVGPLYDPETEYQLDPVHVYTSADVNFIISMLLYASSIVMHDCLAWNGEFYIWMF